MGNKYCLLLCALLTVGPAEPRLVIIVIVSGILWEAVKVLALCFLPATEIEFHSIFKRILCIALFIALMGHSVLAVLLFAVWCLLNRVTSPYTISLPVTKKHYGRFEE